MPLAFLEVKKPNDDQGIQAEFNRMINKRLVTPGYQKYFNLIQVVSFSNNMEYEDNDSVSAELIRAGSFYTAPNGKNTSFSFFREDIKNYHSDYEYEEVDEEVYHRLHQIAYEQHQSMASIVTRWIMETPVKNETDYRQVSIDNFTDEKIEILPHFINNLLVS